jgi:hypothetical protein
MTSDLRDLWCRRQKVGAALDSGLLADDDPAWEQFPDLDEAVREARPTDPAGLAIQMRLLAEEFAAIGHVADETLALRIATALEKLGEEAQHGRPDSGVGILEDASRSVVAPALRPPRRLAAIDGAGRGVRRRLAERFVSQAAALVWTINMWVIMLRAGRLRGRATPARRRAAAGAHGGNAASTAGAAF